MRGHLEKTAELKLTSNGISLMRLSSRHRIGKGKLWFVFSSMIAIVALRIDLNFDTRGRISHLRRVKQGFLAVQCLNFMSLATDPALLYFLKMHPVHLHEVKLFINES